jgi:diguanylate cyclase (GGDEF)-like protein
VSEARLAAVEARAASATEAVDVRLVSAALEASGLAISIRDADGEVLYASPRARALFAEDSPDAPDREERSVDGHAFWLERRRFLYDGVALRVSAAIDVEAQRRLQDELYQRAYFDPLTQLPNRDLCDQAVADLTAAGKGAPAFALAIIEVEKFTQINAVHGDSAGDILLQRIAERIGYALEPDEWLGRCGGDEFCLILAGPPDGEIYRERIGALVARLADPFLVDGVEIFSSAKAGLSLWPKDDAGSEGLWRKARAALAEAKREVGARVRAYDPEMEQAQLRRGKLESNLRAAIRDRRIGCAFQPKFDFRAGVVDSLEVLMRWRDEEDQWNSPGDFLDVAHRIGLMNDITQLVFESVLESLDDIAQYFRPGLHLGFNIAARQAGDARFMRRFAEQLAASGQAHRFVIELTEEAFLPTTQFQTRILPMLREIGARISIDDFGSGFSSLAMLADITADELKVDRSLITDIDKKPRNQTLLRATESIGAALGMEVMVEGIETQAEIDYIREHTKIRVAQGYFFGRPVVVESTKVSMGFTGPRKYSAQRERMETQLRVIERREA